MNMKEYNYKEEEQGDMLACEPSSWGGQWTEEKLDAFENIDKLTSFFGKDESFLKDYFYKKKTVDTLFGEKEIIEKVKKPIEKIAELYIEQLKTIFKHVTEKPLVLYNSRKTPIFHFACASNNSTAIKIASQIINKKQSK